MRIALLLGLALLCGMPARAHDPYEITSVVYVRSNRIELFMEMEFPTGLTLAGQKPARDVAALSQFEAALPQLVNLAGRFFEFTAGNHVVPALRTNVTLGVEDHIQVQVEFAPTPHRPLRFVARGLGADPSANPYGTSLTVLDMVNQKVIGQTTLFAGAAAAEFPPKSPTEPAAADPATPPDAPPARLLPPAIAGETSNAPTETPPTTIPQRSFYSRYVFLVGLGLLVVFLFFRRRT